MSLPDWLPANLDAATPVLNQWADTYGLPRDAVFGLVSQESRFNPRAYRFEPSIRNADGSTHSDASYGLTQILYGTAQGLGYTGTPEGLYDPSTNAEFGLKYFQQKLNDTGDLFDGLAANNAGHPGTTAGARYATETLVRVAYFTTLFSTPASGVPDNSGTSGRVPWIGIVLVVGFLLLLRAILR